MNKFFKVILAFSLLFYSKEILSQIDNSIILQGNLLSVKSSGITFLGSGISEQNAKILAINDAKKNALEKTGTYLESNSIVLNNVLVKDEIITFTGSFVKVKILETKRVIVNNVFAIKIEIEAIIDINLLNERIELSPQNSVGFITTKQHQHLNRIIH